MGGLCNSISNYDGHASWTTVCGKLFRKGKSYEKGIDQYSLFSRFLEIFPNFQMTELTSYLKNEFIKQLHVLDWMDEITRRRAISKANMIEYKSGFPMVLFNDTWMEKNWGMIIKPREYLLHLTIRVKLVRFTEELLRLDQPLDRSMWFQSPAQVDAYYAPNNNEMSEFKNNIN